MNINSLTNCIYSLEDVSAMKKKMLNWAKQFNIFCFLDNRDYSIQPQQYDCLLAVGVQESISSNDLKTVDAFLEKHRWIFGHLSYDLKNSVHHFHSSKKDKIGFPDLYFFSPEILLEIKEKTLTIHSERAGEIFEEINQQSVEIKLSSVINIRQRLTKENYLRKIKSLQKHILRGDCYEINFCKEFFAEDVTIDAVEVFQKLMNASPTPFSALYKLNDRYVICASPERFLKKTGCKIFSQPMKGTIKRNLQSQTEDEKLKQQLQQSAKDRSENVMVVDMVRNDLSKICTRGSVNVDELFGVYSYPTVHQMISTISGELKPLIKFSEVIEATFPMGSMTGAPKLRVMELIEEYEASARGIFSGSIGYINPDDDFDFNVVIRSIMYNTSTKYLSYQAGSGITFYSDPEREWEECLLKGEAIKKVLTG